jgi:O-antigen/teichoic acid export membrane protein
MGRDRCHDSRGISLGDGDLMPVAPGLERRIRGIGARGMGWQGLATIVAQVVQATTSIAVAAAVGPTQFGLWGLVSVVLNGQYLLAALVAPAVIYLREGIDEQDLVDTAVVLNAGLSFGLGALAFVLAPFVASRFAGGLPADSVAAALRLITVALVCASAVSVPQALIEKAMTFRRRALPEIAAILVYAAVVVIGVRHGYGVWSLIVAKTAQGVLLLGFFWAIAPRRPRRAPTFDWRIAGRMLKYGKYLGASALLNVAFGNVDTLIVGLIGGAAAVGSYALAFSLSTLMPTFLSLSMGKVFFPLYAAVRDDPPALREAFASALHYVAVFVVPTTVVLIVLAEHTIGSIFGIKWATAIPLVRVLALYGTFRAAALSGNLLLSGTGRTSAILWVEAIAVGVTALVLWPLVPLGAKGVAWAFTLGQASAGSYALWLTRRLWSLEAGRQLVPPFLAAAVALAAALGWTESTGPGGSLAPLVVFGLVYSAVLLTADARAREVFRSITGRGGSGIGAVTSQPRVEERIRR